jgi:ABC-type transporter Mla MlaB component
MAKVEPSGGIFSKMVRFVKNPTTDWAALDDKESERGSDYSKQALKEMIERKKRNDFVRRREFDMLRKIRRREAMGGSDNGAKPSFFQSSMPSKPDDRAQTLKKIDEIEAQMSMQWWKTKHGATNNSELRSTNFSSAPPSANDEAGKVTTEPSGLTDGMQYAATEPAGVPLAEQSTQALTPPPAVTPDMIPTLELSADAAPTANTAAKPAAKPAAPTATPAKPPAVRPPLVGGLAAGYSHSDAVGGFSQSKLFAVDVDEVAHDPELEEAAIRFANGDDAGAEAGLLEALGPTGTRAAHVDTWLTLFDLYRATGQQDRFENAAIDFAGRFARSAPQWFSMPAMVGQMAKAAQAATAANAAPHKKADWVCPSVLGVQTIAALNVALARVSMPWRLDWSNLKTIEANAVEPLNKLLLSWAVQPVQLRFAGGDSFQNLLQGLTPSNDRQVDHVWWHLRMNLMRVMHRPDEFELAALDFCVTYEVSPPSWEAARCEYKTLDDEGGTVRGNTIIGDAYQDSIPSSMHSGPGSMHGSVHGDLHDTTGTGSLSQSSAQLTTVELAGEIQGDPASMLEKLEQRLQGADIMVISCAKLIRVDFSAAGTLLNWVSAKQNEGRIVQFTDTQRLVASFFNVIGISDHAKVVTRVD